MALFLLQLLLLVSYTVAIDIISSPNGYLITKFYEYAGCDSAVQAMSAFALGACILNNSTVYGAGYLSSIFTKINETTVLNQVFTQQSDCKGQQYVQYLPIGSCSTAGNSVEYSISNDYTGLYVDNDDIFTTAISPFVQITEYNSSSCASDVTKVVVSTALYSQSCLFDCFYSTSVSRTYGTCSFATCNANRNTTVKIYTFDENSHGEYCTVAGYVSTQSIDATCGRDIVCDFPSSNPSSNSNSGTGANNAGLIVGCTIGAVLSVIAIAGLIYYYYFFKKAATSTLSDLEIRDSKVVNILAESNNTLSKPIL